MNISDLIQKKGGRVYLDYAAATPVDRDVLKQMLLYFSENFGNPGGIHQEGVLAKKVIEESRTKIARIINARPHDVVFTSNGTESNNLALYGYVRALHESQNVAFKDIEIISTRIEHPSISEVLLHLEGLGVRTHYCSVDAEGRIDQKEFQTLLSKNTRLCTFAYANSEIGTVEDVKKVSRIVRKYNSEHGVEIKVHLDASQAPLWLPCQIDMLGVDLITLDAGKCTGPKGVGVLAYRHDVTIKGILLGGGQERGLRSGTENTALIVGCACSIEKAQGSWEERSAKVSELRDYMIATLEKEIDGVVLNGSRHNRIANNVNISIPGLDSEFAVVTLDANGIAASTKSACGTGKGGGSKVVAEIVKDASEVTARSESTIRFSLGPDTTTKDIDRAVEVLKKHVEKMKNV